VDDLFTPEIRPVTKARNVVKTEGYDDAKAEAILNEIRGKDHSGTREGRSTYAVIPPSVVPASRRRAMLGCSRLARVWRSWRNSSALR
jgi:hypothetical protein